MKNPEIAWEYMGGAEADHYRMCHRLKSMAQYGYELTPEEWQHINAMREIFRRLEREIGGPTGATRL